MTENEQNSREQKLVGPMRVSSSSANSRKEPAMPGDVVRAVIQSPGHAARKERQEGNDKSAAGWG